MIDYLRNNNYKYKIRVRIVNEESLELIKEYFLWWYIKYKQHIIMEEWNASKVQEN